jgi:alanyl aminopeptidase
MPNADGAGYFRFALKDKDWDALIANASQFTEKEILAALDSLDAALTAGSLDVDKYLPRVKALLRGKGDIPPWDIAAAPIGRLTWIKDHLVNDNARQAVQAFMAELYGPVYDKLGLDPTSEADKANAAATVLICQPARRG